MGEVEGTPQLVPVQVEGEAPFVRPVAAGDRLHPDHLRAHVAQETGAVGPCRGGAQLEDADGGEGESAHQTTPASRSDRSSSGVSPSIPW